MNKKQYTAPATNVVALAAQPLMLSASTSTEEYSGHAGSRGRGTWSDDDE